MGVSGFLHLPVPGVLFNLFAFTVTLWVLVTGMLLWQAPAGRASALVDAVSAA